MRISTLSLPLDAYKSWSIAMSKYEEARLDLHARQWGRPLSHYREYDVSISLCNTPKHHSLQRSQLGQYETRVERDRASGIRGSG